MKRNMLNTLILLIVIPTAYVAGQQPQILKKTYDQITQNSVTLYWTTSVPSDSRVFWMKTDSNYQPVLYTDSVKVAELVTNHVVKVENLQPACMYRYLLTSSTASGRDSSDGYFITQSNSTGNISVWFNHTVDTTVTTGTNANGLTNFEKLIKSQIDKAEHSIDITLWAFEQLDSVAAYLVRAKERGVKIRFVYNHMPDSPQIDTLRAHGIQIVKRTFDTTYTMHNKFWVFDHRYNSNPSKQYLWTGSTNVTHPQFHSDRNNVIIIQDQSLCEVYTREFEEMWGSHTDVADTSRSKFGTEKTDNVAHILNVGGIRMEIYFAPTDSIGDTLSVLFTTRPVKSIFFSMLKFQYTAVESALHEAWLNGIQISGVFDSSCSVLYNSAFPRMKGEAVPGAWQPPADVFIDTIPGLLHHKYSLINADSSDGEKIVTTGSFNWEYVSQKGGDENMLVIYDATINNLYYQEFMARYRESGGTQLGTGWGIHPDQGSRHKCNLKAFPNPFRQNTSIQFSITQPGPVRLVLFDGRAKQLAVWNENYPEPGKYTLSLDGSLLPDGLLSLRLETGGLHQSLKLIHLATP